MCISWVLGSSNHKPTQSLSETRQFPSYLLHNYGKVLRRLEMCFLAYISSVRALNTRHVSALLCHATRCVETWPWWAKDEKIVVVSWLLYVQATHNVYLRHGRLRQLYSLLHQDRSCRANSLSHSVTQYWHQTTGPTTSDSWQGSHKSSNSYVTDLAWRREGEFNSRVF